MLKEAEYLWAAERNKTTLAGISAEWGRVCILPNPAAKEVQEVLDAWRHKIQSAGTLYGPLPVAYGEKELLDPETGTALIDWPVEADTSQVLPDFDILLMTATKATLSNGHYPTVQVIADAWRNDSAGHVSYFYSNRQFGITTFEDQEILAVLRGDSRIATLDTEVSS